MIKTMLIVVIWFNFGLFIGHMLAKFIYQEDMESWDRYADNKAKSALKELRDEVSRRENNVKSARIDNCCLFTAKEIIDIIDSKIGNADE